MSTTDYFGRTVNIGDCIWVPATVIAISGNNIGCSHTNDDGSTSNLTEKASTAGQATLPAEGDRPPR